MDWTRLLVANGLFVGAATVPVFTVIFVYRHRINMATSSASPSDPVGTPSSSSYEVLSQDIETYLQETSYVDISNTIVSDVAKRLTDHLTNEREKACAIFGYVRDEIKYGWTYQFSAMKASDVIISGCGYSVTKSTLFVALLRCAKIPARQIFVDISIEILHGLGFPGDSYLDHSYVEVFVDGNWLKTDAYNIDREQLVNYKHRLPIENIKNVKGVHANCTIELDGTGDAFCQFVDDNLFGALSATTFGFYRDALDFYQTAPKTHNNFDIFFPLTAVFYVTFYIANSRVGQLRLDKDTQFNLIG
jgi:hypothetical protein